MKTLVLAGFIATMCVAFVYSATPDTTIAPEGTAVPSEVDCPPQIEDKPNFIADPKNCSAYYVCNDGFIYHMPCPKGLHFNQIVEACDWPNNVNCTVKPPS